MNTLEGKVRSIIDNAVIQIALAYRNAPSGDIVEAFSGNLARLTAAPSATRTTAKPGPKKGTRARLDHEEILEKLTAAIDASDKPLGIVELAKLTGIKAEALQPSIKKMREAGTIKKQGDKRTTTYVRANDITPAALVSPAPEEPEAIAPANDEVHEEVIKSTTNRYARQRKPETVADKV